MKNSFTLLSTKSKSLKGKLSVPGDKSISIRALLLSSICFGNSKISNLLESDDVLNTLKSLKSLGIKIIKKKRFFEVYGNGGFFSQPSKDLYLGNSGTGVRLLAGLLSTRNINANLLSGGEVRRLQIARTLINNPKVILLDEPMAALDPIVVQDIQKYILKLQSYGTGVIVTDHNIQNLLQVVDKCVVIGEQTIIAEGKPKEILQSAKARELYFGSYE